MTFARQILLIFTPAVATLALVAMANILFQVAIPNLTRDITATANLPPLTGILSSLGIFLWCTAASISLFSAAILHSTNQRQHFNFLLHSGLLSTYLMLDDAFLIHEVLASVYIGIDEKVVFLILGAYVATYLVAFKNIILKTNYAFLVLALGFLSFSIIVDSVIQQWLWRLGDWQFLIEDGAKWLGIVSWCSYYSSASYQFILSNHTE